MMYLRPKVRSFTDPHSVKFQSEMVVLKIWQDFAGGTSIHGFGYLVSPKSSLWTKNIWAISIFVAMMYATLEMRNSVISKYDYVFRNVKYKPIITITYVQIHLLKLEYVVVLKYIKRLRYAKIKTFCKYAVLNLVSTF